MSSDIYVADTSALFAAWVERYPPELFASVWEFIGRLDGRLVVCEEVTMKSTATPRTLILK